MTFDGQNISYSIGFIGSVIMCIVCMWSMINELFWCSTIVVFLTFLTMGSFFGYTVIEDILGNKK